MSVQWVLWSIRWGRQNFSRDVSIVLQDSVPAMLIQTRSHNSRAVSSITIEPVLTLLNWGRVHWHPAKLSTFLSRLLVSQIYRPLSINRIHNELFFYVYLQPSQEANKTASTASGTDENSKVWHPVKTKCLTHPLILGLFLNEAGWNRSPTLCFRIPIQRGYNKSKGRT